MHMLFICQINGKSVGKWSIKSETDGECTLTTRKYTKLLNLLVSRVKLADCNE